MTKTSHFVLDLIDKVVVYAQQHYVNKVSLTTIHNNPFAVEDTMCCCSPHCHRITHHNTSIGMRSWTRSLKSVFDTRLVGVVVGTLDDDSARCRNIPPEVIVSIRHCSLLRTRSMSHEIEHSSKSHRRRACANLSRPTSPLPRQVFDHPPLVGVHPGQTITRV